MLEKLNIDSVFKLPLLRISPVIEEGELERAIDSSLKEKGLAARSKQICQRINNFRKDDPLLKDLNTRDLSKAKFKIHLVDINPKKSSQSPAASPHLLIDLEELPSLRLEIIRRIKAYLEILQEDIAKFKRDNPHKSIKRQSTSGYTIEYIGPNLKSKGSNVTSKSKIWILGYKDPKKIMSHYRGSVDARGNAQTNQINSIEDFGFFNHFSEDNPNTFYYGIGEFKKSTLDGKLGIKLSTDDTIKIAKFKKFLPNGQTVSFKMDEINFAQFKANTFNRKSSSYGKNMIYKFDGKTTSGIVDEGKWLSLLSRYPRTNYVSKGNIDGSLSAQLTNSISDLDGIHLNSSAYLWEGRAIGITQDEELKPFSFIGQGTLIDPFGNEISGELNNEQFIVPFIEKHTDSSQIKEIRTQKSTKDDDLKFIAEMSNGDLIEGRTKKGKLLKRVKITFKNGHSFDGQSTKHTEISCPYRSVGSAVLRLSNSTLEGSLKDSSKKTIFEGILANKSPMDGEAKNFELNYKGMKCLYTGTIKNGEMHGDDIHLVSLDGDFEYRGSMKGSEFNGKGRYETKNKIIEGEFKDHKSVKGKVTVYKKDADGNLMELKAPKRGED